MKNEELVNLIETEYNSSDLDDLVTDVALQKVSKINNCGINAQLIFLRAHNLNDDEILKILKEKKC